MNKLNFGCGDNKLVGWQNYDADVDIRESLRFDDSSENFIFAKHVVAHGKTLDAVQFFKEGN